MGREVSEVNAAIRKRAAISLEGRDIGYQQARNIRRRAERRVNAAHLLSESDDIPSRFRYPKCPEFSNLNGRYFASVFVDVEDMKTGTRKRIRVPVSSPNKLNASEIKSQAIAYIESVSRTDRHQFDTNDSSVYGQRVIHDSAIIGSVCDAT